MPETPATSLILWDGQCGFCRRCVAWVQRADKAGRFAALPYQEAPSPPMTPALARACAKAVHLVEPDGRVLRAGRAVLRVMEQLGWGPLARLLQTPPFVWAVELAYTLVARNRMLFSRWLFPCENGSAALGRRAAGRCSS